MQRKCTPVNINDVLSIENKDGLESSLDYHAFSFFEIALAEELLLIIHLGALDIPSVPPSWATINTLGKKTGC